jgi:hypothetical protein
MKTKWLERLLLTVQDEIEALLAARSVDDFHTPQVYGPLVLLESVLLSQTNRGTSGPHS